MELFKKILVVTLPILLLINLVLATQLFAAQYGSPNSALVRLYGVYQFEVPFVTHGELFDKLTNTYFFPNLRIRIEEIGSLIADLQQVFDDGLAIAELLPFLKIFFSMVWSFIRIVVDILTDVINLLIFIIDLLTVVDFHSYAIILPA